MTAIIPAAQRDTAPRGAKMLIGGPTGVGKTSLLRTLDPATCLFVDIESGDLAVSDVSVDTLRPRTWQECRDLAVYLAGANPAVLPDAVYSREHYAAVVHEIGNAEEVGKYTTFFIDSITAAGRLCFNWASQQPEAFSERSGKRDLRGAYGLHAREMLAWLMHLQQARAVNVVLLGILESVTDEFNHVEHRLQMEGARVSRELPAIVDEIVTMNWISFGAESVPTRAFVCTSPNQWNWPAKDRSGRLQQIEQPHLGELLNKLAVTNVLMKHPYEPDALAHCEAFELALSMEQLAADLIHEVTEAEKEERETLELMAAAVIEEQLAADGLFGSADALTHT